MEERHARRAFFCAMQNEIKEIVDSWINISCDVNGINSLVVKLFNNEPQTLHYPMSDYIISLIQGFTEKLLNDANQECVRSDSFLERLNENIEGYLRFFNVNPQGPDIVKYFWSLGLASIDYIESLQESPLVVVVFKLNMIRGLDAISKISREASNKSQISEAGSILIGKLYDAVKNNKEKEMFGQYGIYSIFKMASVC